ncbi:hypothetical protein Aperf_G00000067322 [Anoplocephala perfoliata]
MSNYAMVPVSIYFLGKMGRTELAAGGLAISIFHVAGTSIVCGLLTASDTLFPQVYMILEITVKYVQAQHKVYPPLAASLIGNLINAGSHYFFYHHTDYGFVGSAFSQSLSYLGQTTAIICYILVWQVYKKTWDSIHVELWHDWGIWFRLAIPGMMMLGLEWWVCESGSILAGLRGEHYLAVQTILNNVESMLFCTFPLGFCISATIRIGRFLGANKAEGPISTALVALITIVFLCFMNAIILLFTRAYIPRIFSNDAEVIGMAAHGLISISVFHIVGGIVGVCSGIIRGVGMQRVGAIVCICCMYLVGGPLGLSLLIFTDLGVSSFWYGLSIGMGAEAIIYVIIILRIDWKAMCREASRRTEIKFVNETSREIEIEFEAESVGDEAISEKVEEIEVRACTPRILLTRGTFVLFCVSTVVIALACRFLLDWRSHFQSYCHLKNGDLIPIDSSNSTQIDPGDCLRILP